MPAPVLRSRPAVFLSQALFVAVLGASAFGCVPTATRAQNPPLATAATPEPVASAAPITIAAVGDIMLGSAWPDARDLPPRDLPPRDGAGLLKEVTPILSRADLAFGNLEGPLVDGGRPTKPGGPHSFAFAVPTRYGVRLKEAGFDLLSLANNHTSDFGARGRASTRHVLDALNIGHAGDKGTVAFRTVRGRLVALVAFAHNNVAANVNDVENARRVVAGLASRADIILVSFHGGGEGAGRQHVLRQTETYLGEARGDLPKFAHAVVDAGADLVLGHGPHVVRGMEVYKGRLIAYSLGNFATYGKFGLSGPTGLSLILEAHLSPANGAFLGGRIHPAKQSKPGGPKRDPSGAVLPVVARLSKQDFGATAVRVGKNGALLAPPPSSAR